MVKPGGISGFALQEFPLTEACLGLSSGVLINECKFNLNFTKNVKNTFHEMYVFMYMN